MGRFDDPPDWEEILTHFRGSELQNYFTKVSAEGWARVKVSEVLSKLGAREASFGIHVRYVRGSCCIAYGSGGIELRRSC